MKKAVLFFGSSSGIGLTEHFYTSIIDIYKNVPSGLDVFLVSDKKEQRKGLWETVEKNIIADRIIKYDEKSYNEINTKIKKIIEQYDKIIIHFQGIKQILGVLKLVKNYRHKIYTVLSIHSFSNGRWSEKIVSFINSLIILKYINKVIFLSPFGWYRFSNAKLLFKKSKIIHIPFNLPKLEVQNKFEDDTILDAHNFNIIYLANLLRHKGHERFWKGIVRFVKEFPDAKIYFMGDGKRKRVIEQKIKNMSLEHNIFCPGRVPRNYLPSIMSKTSIALVLSSSETFGHTILEPTMTGVPLISTRVGVGEYIIQDGVNALGISNNDELYRALKLLKNNPAIRKELAENAKIISDVLFDYTKMIKAYINLYQSF